MRGSDAVTGSLFSYVDLEDRVPASHPLRVIREVVNEAQDGGFRQVKIVLQGSAKSHTVRTRTGYYARGAAPSRTPTPPSSQLR